MLKKLFQRKKAMIHSSIATHLLDVSIKEQVRYYTRCNAEGLFDIHKLTQVFSYSGLKFQDSLCTSNINFHDSLKRLATLERDLIDQHIAYKKTDAHSTVESNKLRFTDMPLPYNHYSRFVADQYTIQSHEKRKSPSRFK